MIFPNISFFHMIVTYWTGTLNRVTFHSAQAVRVTFHSANFHLEQKTPFKTKGFPKIPSGFQEASLVFNSIYEFLRFSNFSNLENLETSDNIPKNEENLYNKNASVAPTKMYFLICCFPFNRNIVRI